MNLREKTWQTTLFKWFFNMEELPDNLCPYFWGIVVLYICLIPYTLLALPYFIGNKWLGDDDNPPTIVKAAIGFLLYLAMFILICMILIFFVDYSLVYIFGYLGWIITIMLGIRQTIIYVKNRKVDKWIDEGCPEDKSSLISKFIKAKYNRYCPKITWK